MSEIFVDGGQFVIIHSSDRTPRHLLADLMAVRIDAGAHGSDEFHKLPILNKIEIGSERCQLSRRTAGQVFAVALAAILIRYDVLAILKCRALRRCRDAAGRWATARVASRSPAA